jgi:hypothetical protein
MPENLKSAHAIFTLLADGILLGFGFGLAWAALKWPWTDKVFGGGALLVCILLILIAYIIP